VSGYHGATEQRPFEAALAALPKSEARTKILLARLNRVAGIPQKADVLDIGAAQGLFVISCARLGHRVVGVEPWVEARATAERVAESVGVTINLIDGVAERLPFEDSSFDIVRANSVVEHVADAAAMFREVYRVLRTAGVFWFFTASSMCPSQGEIRGFPAFGWYPNPFKLRIMNWAKMHRPDLIGYTQYPAVHWFTPWKARRMLHNAGFSKVFDRWDLRLPSEGGSLYALTLSMIRLGTATKFLADVFLPDCSYAAIKGGINLPRASEQELRQ